MKTAVASSPSEIHTRREDFYKELRVEVGKRCSKFDPLSAEVCFNIAQTYARVEDRLAELAQKSGLTLAGFNVLVILSKYKEAGCPQNALSHLLVVSRANITGVVDSLVRKGLVTRSPDPYDRRVVIARLSSKGKELLNSYIPDHYGLMRQLTSCLTSHDKEALIRLLKKARQGFANLDRS